MKTNSTFRHAAPLGYLIQEVARLMKRRFEDEARVHGITLPQWRVLAHIAQDENITQVALAAAIDTDPMTISGVLDRLEKRGLIERYPDPTDSRAKRARLTPEGVELFNTARDVGRRMYDASLEGVSAPDRAIVEATLARMRDNLSGQSAELKELQE